MNRKGLSLSRRLSLRIGPTIYVRFTTDMLSLRLAGTGKEVKGPPAIALNEKKKVVAAGVEAERLRGTEGYTVMNGFRHPRVLIDSFDPATAAIRYYIRSLLKGTNHFISPIMIIHPLAKLEGGLSQIEQRAIKDLAQTCGAREVYIWEGPELTDEDIKNLVFVK